MQTFLMIVGIRQEDSDKIKEDVKSGPKEKRIEMAQSALKKYLGKILCLYSPWLIKDADFLLDHSSIQPC